MNRTFVHSIQRPATAFALPMPVGRRMEEAGKGGWIVLILLVTAILMGMYVYQVSQSSAKDFHVRSLEKQVERLQESVMTLQTQSAQMQSLHSLQERLKDQGYVAVDKMDFIGGDQSLSLR